MQSKKDGEDLKERHESFHRPLFREEVFERCLQECRKQNKQSIYLDGGIRSH